MSGENGTALPARRRDYCPDVKVLLRLLEDATGVALGSQRRLGELVGCSETAMRNWLRGARPTKAYRTKLVEVERSLKGGAFSVGAVLRGESSKPERTLPLMANVVDVNVEGEQALVRFALKIPGEEAARSVAEILIPKDVIERLTCGTK